MMRVQHLTDGRATTSASPRSLVGQSTGQAFSDHPPAASADGLCPHDPPTSTHNRVTAVSARVRFSSFSLTRGALCCRIVIHPYNALTGCRGQRRNRTEKGFVSNGPLCSPLHARSPSTTLSPAARTTQHRNNIISAVIRKHRVVRGGKIGAFDETKRVAPGFFSFATVHVSHLSSAYSMRARPVICSYLSVL